jgi:Flp pilus assembly protein TadB
VNHIVGYFSGSWSQKVKGASKQAGKQASKQTNKQITETNRIKQTKTNRIKQQKTNKQTETNRIKQTKTKNRIKQTKQTNKTNKQTETNKRFGLQSAAANSCIRMNQGTMHSLSELALLTCINLNWNFLSVQKYIVLRCTAALEAKPIPSVSPTT